MREPVTLKTAISAIIIIIIINIGSTNLVLFISEHTVTYFEL